VHPNKALVDSAIDLTKPCYQIYEIPTGLSAPSADLSSFVKRSALPAIMADEIEPCDLRVQSDLDHIKLVKKNEVMARICHATSLFSFIMDPPISLSRARDMLAEIPCLKSVYTSKFQFNLIGDYGFDKDFLVHRICITCDKLVFLIESKSLHLLNHFDMTSNSGIDFMPNSLLQDCLIKPVVACNLEIFNFDLPILGWFNDGHCKVNYNDKCFTYICNLSCHTCFWNMTNRVRHYYELYSCETLFVKHVRGVKTDDIYIYHVHTCLFC
jgi:hypothetical protein